LAGARLFPTAHRRGFRRCAWGGVIKPALAAFPRGGGVLRRGGMLSCASAVLIAPPATLSLLQPAWGTLRVGLAPTAFEPCAILRSLATLRPLWRRAPEATARGGRVLGEKARLALMAGECSTLCCPRARNAQCAIDRGLLITITAPCGSSSSALQPFAGRNVQPRRPLQRHHVPTSSRSRSS
jgi:hypothetical protein